MMFLFGIGSLVLSFLQKIQCFFNVMHWALGEADNLLVHDFEIDCAFLQQIVDLLVVNLEV
jgi:hypothetical protein